MHWSWLQFVLIISVHALRFPLSVGSKCFLHIPVCFSLCVIFSHYLKQGCHFKMTIRFKEKKRDITYNSWCHVRVYMKNFWLNMFVFVWKGAVLCVVRLNVALFFTSVFINVCSCWQTDWGYNTLLPAVFPSLFQFMFCFLAPLFAKLDYSQMLSLV